MPAKRGKAKTGRAGGTGRRGGGSVAPLLAAEAMAEKQREISVSEFFAKNRHLLGFDNPRKALLTTVKEAVDNALDACEEAGILPDLLVEIAEVSPPPSASKSGRYRVTVRDNGPGIVRRQVENIFGKLLYGSKFHRLKMSRGQQGIGISAAGMYGLMTTGKPMVILTRPNPKKPAHHIELAMDTTKNRPEVTVDRETEEFYASSTGTGTSVTVEMEARYARGRASVEEYLEQTAIANPHASITFVPPGRNAEGAEDDAEGAEGEQGVLGVGRSDDSADSEAGSVPSAFDRTTELGDRVVYPRTVDALPPEPKEIRPHPYGVELGTFLTMLKNAKATQLGGFLKEEFSRVTPGVVGEVCAKASVNGAKLSGHTWLKTIDTETAERLYTALQGSKLRPPPTDCLAPIGVRQLLAGMLKGVRAEFYAASTREPAVYRGNPFQIEAAVAFGGDLPAEETARVIRFANRVPLLYQQSACCAFKSVLETSWKNYGLGQPRGSLPVGPLVVMIHMASVWVPFTSESKEAIADYDEIRKEMRLALQECGRKLGTYVRKRQQMRRESERRGVFERYVGEVAKACHAITGTDADRLYAALLEQARKRTAVADAVLDEDGRVVRSRREPGEGDDGVIIVERDGGPGGGGAPALPEGGAARASGGGKGRARARAPRETTRESGGARSGPKPARRAKPRMRLVGGKLAPVEEGPGLF
ncbi:MAG TPA: DNA topoisomerase VI subunit B [Phycisphaerales bacterium]|nr:DNA topoisomerase VI subunit B [Phycisphaerales bacterium]